MGYKVELTYFKPSGKYYSGGDYVSEKRWMHEIFAEVRELARSRRLPGLIEGHSDFAVVVSVPGHPHDHPCLIQPACFQQVIDNE